MSVWNSKGVGPLVSPDSVVEVRQIGKETKDDCGPRPCLAAVLRSARIAHECFRLSCKGGVGLLENELLNEGCLWVGGFKLIVSSVTHGR